MYKPSAFEWQEQSKKQRQQRGSNSRRMLKVLPAGQAAGSKQKEIVYNHLGITGVTLFK